MKEGDTVLITSLDMTEVNYGLCEEMNELFLNQTPLKVIKVFEDSVVAFDTKSGNYYTYIPSDLRNISTQTKEKENQIFHYQPEMIVIEKNEL